MDHTPSERDPDPLTVTVQQRAGTTLAAVTHPCPEVVRRLLAWRLRRLAAGGMRVVASGVRGGRPGVRAMGWVVSRPEPPPRDPSPAPRVRRSRSSRH